ncbi:MAG: CoA pyrophosphatase [Hyphomicrobiaceae bacterium]
MSIDHQPSPFTASGFRALALSRLARSPTDGVFDPRSGRTWVRSDWDLNPEMIADFAVMEPARSAAVLVPIVARDELTVLLTQRPQEMPQHPGQIAFPGGKVEPTDVDHIAAALREAEEEIGLERRFVETLGYLDMYRTGTGYNVAPVVAIVQPEFVLKLHEREVAEAFEVPLAFLMDEANHQKHARPWRGRERHYYAMPFGERYIWGATAGMLKNLQQRLFVG